MHVFEQQRKSPMQAGRKAEKGEAWRRRKVERKTVMETRERESERERHTVPTRGNFGLRPLPSDVLCSF